MPVVLESGEAQYPTAELSLPVVFERRAEDPRAELRWPVVLARGQLPARRRSSRSRWCWTWRAPLPKAGVATARGVVDESEKPDGGVLGARGVVEEGAPPDGRVAGARGVGGEGGIPECGVAAARGERMECGISEGGVGEEEVAAGFPANGPTKRLLAPVVCTNSAPLRETLPVASSTRRRSVAARAVLDREASAGVELHRDVGRQRGRYPGESDDKSEAGETGRVQSERCHRMPPSRPGQSARGLSGQVTPRVTPFYARPAPKGRRPAPSRTWASAVSGGNSKGPRRAGEARAAELQRRRLRGRP